MDLDNIKRGLRAEIKKRENETYSTFQCNVRQMCKDVLAKLEEQESEIAELKERVKGLILDNFLKDKELRHNKYNRCLATAKLCNEKRLVHNFAEIPVKLRFYDKWEKRWLELSEKFKEAK